MSCSTGLDRDALESLQVPNRPRCDTVTLMDVNLHDGIACDGAGIGYVFRLDDRPHSGSRKRAPGHFAYSMRKLHFARLGSGGKTERLGVLGAIKVAELHHH